MQITCEFDFVLSLWPRKVRLYWCIYGIKSYYVRKCYFERCMARKRIMLLPQVCLMYFSIIFFGGLNQNKTYSRNNHIGFLIRLQLVILKWKSKKYKTWKLQPQAKSSKLYVVNNFILRWIILELKFQRAYLIPKALFTLNCACTMLRFWIEANKYTHAYVIPGWYCEVFATLEGQVTYNRQARINEGNLATEMTALFIILPLVLTYLSPKKYRWLKLAIRALIYPENIFEYVQQIQYKNFNKCWI